MVTLNTAGVVETGSAATEPCVPKGYKQTDVGVIPEDWEVAKLGKHATFKTGPFGSALHQSDYVDGGVPVINPMQIIDGKILPSREMGISETAARKLSDFRLTAGDVVIGRRGEMGRCACVRPEQDGWLCGTGSMIIRTGPSLDSRFIQRVLSSPPIVAEIENNSVGSTMISLNQSTLVNLLLPLPPSKTEQEAIARALSEADALIESLEQVISKKRQIKQGAMQDLFSGKKDLSGFGGEWAVVRMRQILTQSATYGIVTAGTFVQNGVRMLRGGDIVNGHVNSDLPMVSREKAAEYSRTVLLKNDVVIALVGYPGASAKIPDELIGANISRAVGLLRLNGKVLADYLVCFLNSPYGRRMVLAPSAGSAQQVVNLAALNKLEFSIPPLPEQTAVAGILTEMDAEIAALEEKLAKARMIKQGTMQELLTGRIRLI